MSTITVVYLCPICDRPLDEESYCHECRRSFMEELAASQSGTLTAAQISQQDAVDNACAALVEQFVPDAPHDIAQITVIRDALVKVLKQHNVAAYDVYPWLLAPGDISSVATADQTIVRKDDETLRIITPLADWNPDNESPDMPIEIVVTPRGISLIVPEISTFSDQLGQSEPIFIEQNDGKLALYAWDDSQEDPVIKKQWARFYRAFQGTPLAEAVAASLLRSVEDKQSVSAGTTK